jgi:hypothetical protein
MQALPAGLHCQSRPLGLLPLLAAWLRWQASERISEEMMSDDEPGRRCDEPNAVSLRGHAQFKDIVQVARECKADGVAAAQLMTRPAITISSQAWVA